MKDKSANILTAIDNVRACTSLDALYEQLVEYGQGYGYEIMFVGSFGRLVRTNDRFPPSWTNADPSWTKYYLEHELHAIDPHVHMAGCSTKPFSYEQAYANETPNVIEYRKFAEAAGVVHGVTIPIHLQGRPAGLVQYTGKKNIKLNDKQQLEQTLFSMVLFDKVFEFYKLEMPEFQLTLSDRERSVLTLVARGKTNWEVGAVLSISEYSVRDYLKRLSVRFETSNRTHTVARAMQLGLIVP